MAELKIYWFGYGGNSFLAEELRPVILDLGMTLTTIHEWANADIQWNRPTWIEHLKKADIIIVPANWKVQPAKSNNRLTQALALGKPVICSPLLSYKKVAEKHPGSFLFADSREEWRSHLQLLRDRPDVRKQLSEKALEAAKGYSVDVIGNKWLDVFSNIDKVDIVIPTYSNLRGIRLCLESIKACTEVLHNIIVVDNGTDEDSHQYLSNHGSITYIRTGRSNFAQAVNAGIKAGKAKYVCILNDDVIVSKGWLKELLNVCKDTVGMVGPLSNCDKGWLHDLSLNIGGVELLPGLNTFDQIEPILEQIHEFQSPHTDIPERDWIAYYCALMPREVIEKAGFLNEEFINSGEDVDHCRRIKKQGYRIIQNYKSFVFHFGAVSRKVLEQENPGSYHEADKKTNQHLKHLWDRESVMIYSGPSYERWDFRNIDNGGIGGSETWQVWVSRELSKLGYRVTSFADCPEPGIMDGDVQWLHYTDYNRCVDQHWYDYAILSRSTDPLKFPLRAGKVFVQIHDVWLMSDRNQTFVDKVTKFCCLSDWHRDFFADYHKIPKEKIALTANGIDFDRFDGINEERNPYRLHWSSSLDRGIDNVLYMWPFIKEKIPQAELHVFYGTLNWRKSAESKNDGEALKKIELIEEGLKQPGIFNHGRISQKELAIEMKKSSLLLYPQWFSETFFISGIECQRAGMPVIANKYAGVITTLGDSAILLGNGDAWWPYSKEGREAFLSEAISILTDRTKWQHWSEKGFKNTENKSWAHVAQRWRELFGNG